MRTTCEPAWSRLARDAVGDATLLAARAACERAAKEQTAAGLPHRKGRTSIEWINARRKMCWVLDDGNLHVVRRFLANLGALTRVHSAFATVLATTPCRPGTTLGTMKLSPIAKAQFEKLPATSAGTAS